jgi:hypothetical protein
MIAVYRLSPLKRGRDPFTPPLHSLCHVPLFCSFLTIPHAIERFLTYLSLPFVLEHFGSTSIPPSTDDSHPGLHISLKDPSYTPFFGHKRTFPPGYALLRLSLSKCMCMYCMSHYLCILTTIILVFVDSVRL